MDYYPIFLWLTHQIDHRMSNPASSQPHISVASSLASTLLMMATGGGGVSTTLTSNPPVVSGTQASQSSSMPTTMVGATANAVVVPFPDSVLMSLVGDGAGGSSANESLQPTKERLQEKHSSSGTIHYYISLCKSITK